MNAAIKAVLSKNFPQAYAIPDIRFIKRNLPTGNFFYTLHCQPAGIDKIIYDCNAVSGIKQLYNCMRADIAGPPCN